MESILTVLFFILGNGAMIWLVFELRERYEIRRDEKRGEREAYDGMLRLRYQRATEEVARREREEAEPPTEPTPAPDPIEEADQAWPYDEKR